MLEKALREDRAEPKSLESEAGQLIVDYLVGRAALAIVQDLSGSPSSDSAELVENFVFRQLRSSGLASDLTAVEVKNRRQVPSLAAKILGVLSKWRFKEIATRFFKEVTATSARSMKAAYIIEGARHLLLPLESVAEITLSVTFLEKLCELFIHTARLEVKQVLSDLMLRLSHSVLLRMDPAFLAKHDLSLWNATILTLFTRPELSAAKKDPWVRIFFTLHLKFF